MGGMVEQPINGLESLLFHVEKLQIEKSGCACLDVALQVAGGSPQELGLPARIPWGERMAGSVSPACHVSLKVEDTNFILSVKSLVQRKSYRALLVNTTKLIRFAPNLMKS